MKNYWKNIQLGFTFFAVKIFWFNLSSKLRRTSGDVRTIDPGYKINGPKFWVIGSAEVM